MLRWRCFLRCHQKSPWLVASGLWPGGPEQPPYLIQEFPTALEMPRSAQSGSLFNEAGCRRPHKERQTVSPHAHRCAVRSAEAEGHEILAGAGDESGRLGEPCSPICFRMKLITGARSSCSRTSSAIAYRKEPWPAFGIGTNSGSSEACLIARAKLSGQRQDGGGPQVTLEHGGICRR